MLGRDFAGTSANIGLGAMQKAMLKPNEPNLGVMLANGIKAYDNNQKKQAYVDALQGGDQDAINKAWADYDADGYAQYLQNKEATQTDFANKLAMLDKENEYATGLENLQNSNAYGLAKFRAGLQEQAEAAEIARKNDEIAKNDAIAQEMLNNGQISKNQYDLWRLTRNEKALGIGNSEKETQAQKEQAKREQQRLDFEASKPSVINAMRRGYAAAENGWGLGGIGGTAVNPASWFGKGTNQNRADIQAANTQMNSILRKQLASSGLTGSELNSEAEAKAYRYTIAPTDNEENIKRKMQDFVTDVLGEDAKVLQQKQNYKSKYGLE